MAKINRIEIVELPVINTNLNKFYFGEIPNLKNKIISFINSLHSYWINKSPGGYPLIIESEELCTSYITLIDNSGKIVFDNYPIIRFTAASYLILGFINRINHIIDWEKSYILNPGTKYANRAYVFTVFYNLNHNVYKKDRKYFCRSVEIVTDSTTKNRFYFPINASIFDKKIEFIEIMAFSQNPILPSGRNCVNMAASKEATILIEYKESNKEYSIKFPLWGFDAYTQWKKNMFRGIEINLEKSFVEFATTGSLVLGEAVQLYFFWSEKI